MKIRAITIGLSLTSKDFETREQLQSLQQQFLLAKQHVNQIQLALEAQGYQVQTTRICFNSFEDWLLPLLESSQFSLESIITSLDQLLITANFDFCSIGNANTIKGIKLIPSIFAFSNRLSCSALTSNEISDAIAPNLEFCQTVSKICIELHQQYGDLANFRFCASFNCSAGIPFFPSAYHLQNKKPAVSIALENGDLIFLGCFAAKDHNEASNNLYHIFQQSLLPIEKIVEQVCQEIGIDYNGIDASLNPGLTPPDSIATGLEHLLPPTNNHFGQFGTLAAVSTITAAVKRIQREGKIKVIGYNGLMLPVMEDLTLSARANEEPPCYSLRDLMVFSTICGVGLDTVPIPGDSDPETLAWIYMELGTLSFRLKKPLSCRLLPMAGLTAGQLTTIESPYLCNTKVFSIDR